MPRYGKWETIKELGSGGQGIVHLSYDTDRFNLEEVYSEIRNAILNIGAGPPSARRLAEALENYINRSMPSRLGALKIFHGMGPSADTTKARERMSREIQALQQVKHPHLIRILDTNLDEGWFVCEYYERGPISEHRDLFRGDFVKSLRAFRPLVEAVADVHQNRIVHRDIKPQNVFLGSDGQLVLGDMGLVFFEDTARARITETLESVGTTDWMPGWAMGMRLEDVRASFDVFSLGKLLWSIVSGKPLLRLWYWNDPQFDLEQMFRGDPAMIWGREIFRRSVVELENSCLRNAEELLGVVDSVLRAVSRNAQVVNKDTPRLCFVCGVGKYLVSPVARHNIINFGLTPAGRQNFYVFECSHCGHVQLFSLPRGMDDPPPAWK